MVKKSVLMFIPFLSLLWLWPALAYPPAQFDACQGSNGLPVTNAALYRAISGDGLNFAPNETPILAQAHSPELSSKGLYFVSEQANQQGIWVGTPQADGTIVPVDCIKLNNQFDPQAVAPDVVQLSSGLYRLFYARAEGGSILSAASSDGVNFTIEQEVLNLAGATQPTVVQLANGGWLMGVATGGNQLTVLTSEDGYSFTSAQILAPQVGGQVAPELALLADGAVRLFAGGDSLVSYLSPDGGQTWQSESPGATLATSPVNQPTVQNAGGQWQLVYSAPNNSASQISGVVMAQGRTDQTGTNLYLSESCGSSPTGEPVATTGADGAFTLPASPRITCLQARRPGYLIGQRTNPTGDIGTLNLLGGDVNGDDEINIFDLSNIAGAYGTNDVAFDVNGDGIVDIFDLTTAAINYNQRGPTE